MSELVTEVLKRDMEIGVALKQDGRGPVSQGVLLTTDGLEILRRRFFSGRRGRVSELAEARVKDEIGRKVHDLRTATGLTRAQLGKMVGTTTSAICAGETGGSVEGNTVAGSFMIR